MTAERNYATLLQKKSIQNGIIDFKEIYNSNYMKTRTTDQYEVSFCNTEILNKSAMRQMQRSPNITEQTDRYQSYNAL